MFLSLNFENSLFLGLLKHYKIGVSAKFCVLCCWKRRKQAKKNDNWNLWIWVFLVQKWPFRDAHLLFKKKGPETPIFILFFGCALFGPSCQKREILDTHPKKKKIFTDNWKAHFWVFFVFSCFFSFFFLFLFFCLFCFFCVFLEGLRVMWGGPEGPPHLALNPPYLFFVLFLFCFFFVGSGEVARRATSLGPKPSLFVFFCLFSFGFVFFLVHFLSLFLIEKSCFPPPKRAFFVFFSVFPFLSP